MFRAMQRNFEDQLQRKKSQTAHTIPKSPNFEKTKSRPLDRDQFNEAAPKIQQFKALSRQKSVSDQPVKQPSSTRSMVLLQERRREEIEADRKRENEKIKEDKERKIR